MSSQRQEEEQKRRRKRNLHRKHEDRRKKDVMPGIPFIMGFMGDPALKWRCAQQNFRDHYDLIPYCMEAPKRNSQLLKFNLLKRYAKHAIQEIYKVGGRILIKNAPMIGIFIRTGGSLR